MHWKDRYAPTQTSRAEAIARIPKGKHIFIGSGAAEPSGLVAELVAQADRFADNTVVHMLTLGPAPYVEPAYKDRFRHNAFFIGHNVREAVHAGRADYTPVFLSQIPGLIRSRRTPVDVSLIQVSPPDKYGFVNLGVSVDIVLAAIQASQLVIAEINPQMPVIYGAGFVPMDQIHAWVSEDNPLPELPRETPDEVAREIGRHVASLNEDTSTLQLGIGEVPNAILDALDDRKDLGIWTEMFSDGAMDLIESGNITGKYTTTHPSKVSASFTFGSQRLYEFLDHNPIFTFHPSDVINNPIHIAEQHRMVAVNSALQVDVTGQVCADSIGGKFYSGIGGQVDFIRGASMCPGGKPIIAMRSTAKGGKLSRIVAALDEGAGVVTSRGDVQFVVTEYGVANLYGKSIRERALSLISIAHPDFRSDLLDATKARHYVFPDQVAPRALYPHRYEKKVLLSRGTAVLLRPIRITDEQKMTDLFYSLSDKTIYERWLNAIQRKPEQDALDYLDVDYKDRMVMVAEVQLGAKESELVGVSRYYLDARTNYADAAVVIRDDWQGQGLGTQLLGYLLQIAREQGVAGFTAEILKENVGMLHLLHKYGLDIHSSLDGSVYSVRMPFDGGQKGMPTSAGAKQGQSRA